MNRNKIKDKIKMLLSSIIIVGIISLIICIPEIMNKKICESNGGIYIWSFNQYENKCYLRGDSNE